MWRCKKSAITAVALVSQPNGFLCNPRVRMLRPCILKEVAKQLKKSGRGQWVDELVSKTDRAAPAAIPVGRKLLVGAVRSMLWTSVKNIRTDGDNPVTQFLPENPMAAGCEVFGP